MQWSEITAPPTQRKLREFAATIAVICGLLTVWQGWRNHNVMWLWIMGDAAIAAALVGWLRPRWLAPLFTASLIAVFPLAWVVSTLILMVAYYLVLTPIALVLRLAGRDALDLRPRPDQDSYWTERTKAESPKRYLKQF